MIYIIIVYKGRKYFDIEISETNTVRDIINIFYNKIEKPQNERFYTQDKILLKFNDSVLNKDNDSLI